MTITALLVSLYDRDGSLVWVDWILVPDAARPGQSVHFRSALTARDRLAVVDAELGLSVNGLAANPSEPFMPAGAIVAPDGSGYGWVAVQPVVFERSSA